MNELDLHGVRHAEVERKVENFVLLHDCPLLVITGNSPTMKRIVEEVCKRHGLKCSPQNDYNLGALVVTENC